MKRKNTGFTLVEILIVVIILGILAAIVIPQFTEASNDARKSALVSDLQTARSQVELFKVQHLDTYPGYDGGAAFDANDFVTELTGKTDQDGSQNDSGRFGPYLQKFPTNPFNDLNNVKSIDSTDDNNKKDMTYGWWFDPSQGRFGVMDDQSTNYWAL